MAALTGFWCTHCEIQFSAWDDADAYYFDEQGKKQYAYHPDHDALARCVGYEITNLCLDCGRKFKSDSQKPKKKCTKRGCGSTNFKPLSNVDGEICPYCKQGVFHGMNIGIS